MELREKIRGAIVGCAYGDALALGTEFMTHQEVATYYPNGLRSFGDFIHDAHRSLYKAGQWTNVSDMMLAMIDAVIAAGHFDFQSLAPALKKWVDNSENDFCPKTRRVCNEPGWVEHPMATAHDVWRKVKFIEASNEALPRALLTGIVSTYHDLEENTRKIILMTHDDTRCVSTAIVIAKMVNALLHEEHEASIDKLKEVCRAVDPRTMPFLEKAYAGNIASVEVDDQETMCWTRKAMAAALYGLWFGKDAPDAIYKVVELGGDSCMNAAIAGTMVGIKYGYEGLPREVRKMPGLERLLDTADRLTEMIKSHMA